MAATTQQSYLLHPNSAHQKRPALRQYVCYVTIQPGIESRLPPSGGGLQCKRPRSLVHQIKTLQCVDPAQQPNNFEAAWKLKMPHFKGILSPFYTFSQKPSHNSSSLFLLLIFVFGFCYLLPLDNLDTNVHIPTT